MVKSGFWQILQGCTGTFEEEDREMEIEASLYYYNLKPNGHYILLNLDTELISNKTFVPNDSADCDCGKYEEESRIVGGSEADTNEFPWHVGIISSEQTSLRPFCGGTLISKHCVLTAAHCLKDIQPFMIRAVVGDHDWRTINDSNYTKVFKIKEIIRHPQYNFANRKTSYYI